MRTVFENSSFLTEAYSGTPSRNPSYGRISTRSNSGHCSNSQEMLPSFSRGSKVQVEYKAFLQAQHGGGLGQNIALQAGEKFRPVLFPRFYHLFIFQDIPPGARSVDQNLIKILRKILAELSGSSLKTSILPIQRVPDFQKSFGPGTADIIRNQYAFPVKLCPKFSPLPPGAALVTSNTRSPDGSPGGLPGSWRLALAK